MEHCTVVIKTNIYMTDIDKELKKSNMRIGWIGELIGTRTRGETRLCEVVAPILHKSEIVDNIKLILPSEYISYDLIKSESIESNNNNVSAIELDNVDSFIMTIRPKDEELKIIYENKFRLTDVYEGRYTFERLRRN
jgi:hypothetical protein